MNRVGDGIAGPMRGRGERTGPGIRRSRHRVAKPDIVVVADAHKTCDLFTARDVARQRKTDVKSVCGLARARTEYV
jgi:hypothetical protein